MEDEDLSNIAFTPVFKSRILPVEIKVIATEGEYH